MLDCGEEEIEIRDEKMKINVSHDIKIYPDGDFWNDSQLRFIEFFYFLHFGNGAENDLLARAVTRYGETYLSFSYKIGISYADILNIIHKPIEDLTRKLIMKSLDLKKMK